MLALSLDELFAYTDEERGKWRVWLETHPAAMDLRLQPEGRFATVGTLIDHIFLVEARHLARMEGRPVPDSSGIRDGDTAALFAYAGRTRDALRAYAAKLDEVDAHKPRDLTVQSGTFRMTPRKLLLHICLHEIRHWAQIALGARQGGLAPPGNHDFFYSKAVD
jgi:uncharacterized damage-inducible protein DinB